MPLRAGRGAVGHGRGVSLRRDHWRATSSDLDPFVYYVSLLLYDVVISRHFVNLFVVVTINRSESSIVMASFL